MNVTSAKEWLIKSWHHLSSAQVLYKAEHYTDVIAIDLHYSVEISLKAFLAYENKAIPKTHNLLEVHSHVIHRIDFDEDEKDLLRVITTYHVKESYPAFHRTLPPRDEIQKVLIFSEALLKRVCELLDMSLTEIKSF